MLFFGLFGRLEMNSNLKVFIQIWSASRNKSLQELSYGLRGVQSCRCIPQMTWYWTFRAALDVDNEVMEGQWLDLTICLLRWVVFFYVLYLYGIWRLSSLPLALFSSIWWVWLRSPVGMLSALCQTLILVSLILFSY